MGLAFSKDQFNIERYVELRNISAEIIAEHTELKMENVVDLFTNETGYQTPKVDVRGAVFRDNKILMGLIINGRYLGDFAILVYHHLKIV